MTSLPPPTAVAASPPHLLWLRLLHQVRGGGALGAVRVVVAAQSHRIGYHRGAVLRGVELSAGDGDLTVWVVQ